MSDTPIILIAEDDAGHFALVKKNLWRTCADVQVIHFHNGREVLDYLFEHSGRQTHPAHRYLLLLDIKMPLLDGVSVLERIKAHPELRKMPVFMLTTTDSPVEIDNCYQIGCNFYIVKPADYMQFMEAIESLGSFLSTPGLVIPEIDRRSTSKWN